MRTTDFYDDVNQQTLYSLEKLTGVPDFVKSASVEAKEEIGRLPVHVFADPHHRKFPVHTKAATWLANAYFKQAAAQYSTEERQRIQQRISKAANFWRIGDQVKTFNDQWERLNTYHAPRNLPDDQYALIYKTAGYEIRKFPIPNSASLKLAAERLYADRHRYTYPMRKFAATRILKAQTRMKAELQPETTDFLIRAAGNGGAIPMDIATKLAQRAIMVKKSDPDAAMGLAKIAEAIENDTYLPHEQLEKLASLVDSVDQRTGLYKYYHDGVELPEEFIFNIQEKEAQAFVDAHVQLTTGTAYALKDLQKLPLAKIAGVLGQDFADAVTDGNQMNWEKFAEVVPTLPRDDARLLENLIKDAENDVIPGGKAQGMPTSLFPPDQVEKGIKIEKEHTPSKAVAKEIAKDHLVEAKDYYDPRLKSMEQKMEKDKDAGKTKGTEKEARLRNTPKYNAKETKELFKGMGAEVEDADDVTDFKQRIRFKTGG